MEEGIDFVVCRECGKSLRRVDNGHVQKIHGMTPDGYKLKYPNVLVACKAYLQGVSDSVKEVHANPNSVYKSKECKRKKRASLLEMWANRTSEERHTIGAKSGAKLVEYYTTRPELVAQISAKTKEQWADPKGRDKFLIGLYASWTDERKENASKKWREFHQDPSSLLGTEKWSQQISDTVTEIWELEDSPYRTEERYNKISITSKERWRDGTMDGVFVSPTKPELLAEEMLKELSLPYDFQHRIKTDDSVYIVDFLIGNILVLEIFGDYWHGPEKPEQQMKDERRLDWLEGNGFDTLVLWEHEIKEDPQLCSDIIKNHTEEFSIFAK